jgi:poly(A) polymerase
MLRAVALAARLDFDIDAPILRAIHVHRHEIARSSAARLLEEYYKILRAGSAEKTFRRLAEVGLLEPVSAELHRGATDRLWASLAELDAYRRQFESTPDTLTNPMLLGSLLVPLGVPLAARRPVQATPEGHPQPRHPSAPRLGELPLARRDLERLQHVLRLQPRLRDLAGNPEAQSGFAHRAHFRDALTWFEIHGGSHDLTDAWKQATADWRTSEAGAASPDADGAQPVRRRRRRRRRFHRAPEQ